MLEALDVQLVLLDTGVCLPRGVLSVNLVLNLVMSVILIQVLTYIDTQVDTSRCIKCTLCTQPGHVCDPDTGTIIHIYTGRYI